MSKTISECNNMHKTITELMNFLDEFIDYLDEELDMDTEVLEIQISTEGRIRIANVSDKVHQTIYVINIKDTPFLKSDVLNALKKYYDKEIRQTLIDRINDVIFPSISTEALERISKGDLR